MITPNKKVTLYGIIIALLLLLFIFVYLTLPAINGWIDARDLVEQRELEWNEKKLLAENLLEFGPQDQFSLAAIRKYIPERPYTEHVLRDLKSLEQISGILFSNYNLSTSEVSENDEQQTDNQVTLTNNATVPLEISFTFRGKRSQLKTLLKEIEHLERIYHVTNLNITTDANVPVTLVGTNETINGSITLATYYVPALQKHFETPQPLDTF